VQLPDVRACAVAGRLTQGMDCATSLSGRITELNFNETIQFLEPSIEPEKPPAICLASGDWTKIKTALEQACVALKRRCTKEIKESIAIANVMVESLENISMNKRMLLK
jgi:hypothetical protein